MQTNLSVAQTLSLFPCDPGHEALALARLAFPCSDPSLPPRGPSWFSQEGRSLPSKASLPVILRDTWCFLLPTSSPYTPTQAQTLSDSPEGSETLGVDPEDTGIFSPPMSLSGLEMAMQTVWERGARAP